MAEGGRRRGKEPGRREMPGSDAGAWEPGADLAEQLRKIYRDMGEELSEDDLRDGVALFSSDDEIGSDIARDDHVFNNPGDRDDGEMPRKKSAEKEPSRDMESVDDGIDSDCKDDLVQIGSIFITKEKLADIRARREKNEPFSSIARDIHVSPRTLADFLDEERKERFSPSTFVDKVVNLLRDQGPMKQGDLCNALGCGKRTLKKYGEPSGRIHVDEVAGSRIFRLSDQDGKLLSEKIVERGVKGSITIDQDGSFIHEGVRIFVDPRLGGIEFTIVNRKKTMLLFPSGDVIALMPEDSPGLYNQVTNRDYGRERLINSRGELNFNNISHIVGKEFASWRAEVHKIEHGLAAKLVNPINPMDQRQIVIIEKDENPTGMLARKVDGNGSIWLKIHADKDQDSFFIGNELRGKLIFLDIKYDEKMVDIHLENKKESPLYKKCTIDKELKLDDERRITSGGTFQYDRISYFVGQEYANLEVYIEVDKENMQIEVYADKDKENLLKIVPIRNETRKVDSCIRKTSKIGTISWNGVERYVGKEFANQFLYIRPHLDEKELDVFSDEKMTNLVSIASNGFDRRDPTLHLEGISNATKKKFLEMDRTKVLSMWNRRINAEKISTFAKELGVPYEDMEKVFSVNHIGPKEGNLEELQDYTDHYHPGSRIISEYKGSNEPVDIICENGHEFSLTPGSIKDGIWCPDCYQDEFLKSEAICRHVSETLFGTDFKTSKLKWLINENGYRLHLDMYNERLKIAIEYNGKQHYEVVDFFEDSIEKLRIRQKNDRIKEKLCDEHGISLIIVPYWIKSQKMKAYIISECWLRGIEIKNLNIQ